MTMAMRAIVHQSIERHGAGRRNTQLENLVHAHCGEGKCCDWEEMLDSIPAGSRKTAWTARAGKIFPFYKELRPLTKIRKYLALGKCFWGAVPSYSLKDFRMRTRLGDYFCDGPHPWYVEDAEQLFAKKPGVARYCILRTETAPNAETLPENEKVRLHLPNKELPSARVLAWMLAYWAMTEHSALFEGKKFLTTDKDSDGHPVFVGVGKVQGVKVSGRIIRTGGEISIFSGDCKQEGEAEVPLLADGMAGTENS